MTAKEDAFNLVQQARDAWVGGDRQEAWDLLDSAAQALAGGGHTHESMPGFFGYIEFLQGRLRELIAENAAGMVS